MKKLENKKILFIGPKFFNYHEIIIEKLTQQKNEVTFISEAEYSRFEWFISKTSSVLEKYYLSNLVKRKVFKLGANFDVVFLIHGEWIRPHVIENIKFKNPTARFIMYQWDSTISNPNILKISYLFDKVFSFDRLDCTKNENFIYLPLFFSDSNLKNSNLAGNEEFDLLFFGKGHNNRLKTLEKIKHELNECLNIKLVILMSPITYFIQKYLRGNIHYLKRCDFIFKPIKYNHILSLTINSKAVIDIEHSQQTGLTIRTFEVLSIGKKLITTNPYIKEEPFFNDQLINVIDRNNPKIPNDFLQRKTVTNIDFSSYNISNWLNTIFAV